MLMPEEILALIDKPWLLFMLLLAGALFGMVIERSLEKASRAKRRAWWEKRNARRAFHTGVGVQDSSRAGLRDGPDAADQLRTVMNASFFPRALLNKPERRLLAHIDRVLAEDAPGWRAMGQVSLGEILGSRDHEAFRAINAKRVDLLIVDRDCRPLHAVEFQGTGHHQGTAAARDAVKKEALRRAGIGYVEVTSGDSPADVRAIIRKLYARDGQKPRKAAVPANGPQPDSSRTSPAAAAQTQEADTVRVIFGRKGVEHTPDPSL
ncbi:MULTISPECIES: DUF2726 domain-containing protein [unclassified Sphingobium]|uniref:DUF2726 domain-containing protein n=2 Tax=Sphingobium TaxID=165695 RepID=UPI001C852EB0|nr:MULTISPECIES: DUF2726 domain-containing protein [unclassified Sphingobium]